MRKLGKSHADLLPIVRLIGVIASWKAIFETSEGVVTGEAFSGRSRTASANSPDFKGQMKEAEDELKVALLPKDPND